MPIAIQHICLSVAMQVIAGLDSTGERPFLLVTPDICSHDEELDRGFTHYTKINTFEPVVEPTHLQTDKINLQVNKGGRGSKTKVQVTNRIRYSTMRPGSDQQFALAGLWRTSMLAHDYEILDGIFQVNNVPATSIESGNRYI